MARPSLAPSPESPDVPPLSEKVISAFKDLLEETYVQGPSGSIRQGREHRNSRDEVRAGIVMVLSDKLREERARYRSEETPPDEREIAIFEAELDGWLKQGPGLPLINEFYRHADDGAWLEQALMTLFSDTLKRLNIFLGQRRSAEVPKTAVDDTSTRVRQRAGGAGLELDPEDFDLLSGRQTGRGAVDTLQRGINERRYEKDGED